MKKRLLSILIRCCMVSMMLTLLPVTTYAESGAADVETQLKAVDEAKTEHFDSETDELMPPLRYATASSADKLENSTPDKHFTKTPSEGKRAFKWYTIKATPVKKAGNGGIISPSGSTSIRGGNNQTFIITPDKGYAILDVKVDDTSVGPVKSYTFENVSENHTIDASFIKIKLRGIPTLSKNAITFGEALDTIRLSGKLYDDANNVDVDGTFEWKDGRIKPDANDNYQAEWKFTPEDTETYEETSGTVIITVNKAAGRILNRSGQKQKYTDSSDHTYMPDWSKLPSGQEWSYSSEYSVSNGSAARITRHDVAVADGKLTYAVSGGVAGDVISFTLRASCGNYEDFTIELNIMLTEKDDQEPLVITGDTSVIYGQTLTLGTTGGSGTGGVTYTVTGVDGQATIDANGVLTPVKAGTVKVTAVKAGDNDYNEITSAPVEIIITMAASTGVPRYTGITTGGRTLKDAALTTEGSTLKPNAGRLEWVDDKGNVLSDDTKIEANTVYRWRFTPDDANYMALTGEVELYHKTGGGSSSGGNDEDDEGSGSTTSGRNTDAAGENLPDYVVKGGKWFRDNIGRWFFSTDHTYTDEWGVLLNPYADTSMGQSRFDWFHFGKDSVMTTGWYTDKNGDTFYLNPVSDNTLGRMFTGWNWIDDNGDGISECYYFQEISNGRRGRLYKGTTTPDGYTVNEKGQWTVNGVVQTMK